MKGIQFGVVGVVLPALTFLLAASAIAEPKLTPVPDGLTVAGIRGFDQVRTLVLKPSATTQTWKLTPTDLSRKDGLAIFSASLIHANPSTGTQVAATDLVSIPIQFDLSHAPASGQFSGVLLVRYDGGDATIPVTLSIKDPPWFALLLVILGVIAGLSLSTYQAEGLDRDEIVVQVERLRVQMESNKAFLEAFPSNGNPFWNRINGVLVKVDTALTDKKWEEARSLAGSARAIWDKWRGDEAEWLRLLKYKQEELDSRLDTDLSTGIPYGKAVKHNLENAVLQMPEYDSPRQFGEKLQEIQQQIDRYLQGQQQIDRLNLLKNQMVAIPGVLESQKVFWNGRLVALQNRLDALLPTDQTGFDACRQETDADLQEMTHEIEQAGASEETEKRFVIATRDAEMRTLQKERVLDLPFISARKPEESPARAEKRIRWNRQALKWMAVVSLAGVGFNQLYLSNSTFGANWFGDYLTLLAWGFGAEASRESVTKVLQRFRLPGA